MSNIKVARSPFSSGRSASYSDAVLADSPVGYWRLGETSGTTAVDSATNPHNGTYSGGFTLGQQGALPSYADTAVAFDGTGFVSIADTTVLRLAAPFTLECWVNPPNRASDYGLIAKSDVGSARAYEFSLASGSGLASLVVGAHVVAATSPAALGAYTHLAVAYDGANANFYVNAVAAGTPAMTDVATQGAQSVFLAARGAADQRLVGNLQHVALYATALSGARILAHYNAR